MAGVTLNQERDEQEQEEEEEEKVPRSIEAGQVAEPRLGQGIVGIVKNESEDCRAWERGCYG